MPSKVINKASLNKMRDSPSDSSSSMPITEEHKEPAAIEAAVHKQSKESTALAPIPIWRIVLITISLSIGLFLAIMDTSIVSTAIYSITDEFGSLGNATWIILAYTLTYLGFAVIVTRLADVVGRKAAVIASFVVFIAASLGCGFSQSLNALIACRALQGVGGAGMYSLTLVVLPEISPLRVLPFISALIGLIVAIAGVLGPILGGIISQRATWRWIFWMNVPIGIVPLTIFVFAWPRHVTGYELIKQRLVDIDVVGCILLVASSVLFVFGLQEAGIGAYEWSSPTIICTLLFGALSFVLLLLWEYSIWRRYGDDKIAMILPFRILRHRVMLAGILSTMFTGFSMLVCIFNIPLRFQFVNLNSPTDAGLHLLPFLGAMAAGTMAGGAISMVKNNTFSTFVMASVYIIVGDGLLSTLGNGLDIQTKFYGFQVLVGFGVGMTLSTISLMTSLEVDFRDHAVGQGIVGQVRVLGGSIGVATSSAVFNRQLHQQLSGVLTPGEISGLQTSFGAIINTLSLDKLEAIREVFASSFDETLRICTYVAALGVIAAFFTYQQHPPSIARRKAELVAAVEQLHADALEKERKGGH